MEKIQSSFRKFTQGTIHQDVFQFQFLTSKQDWNSYLSNLEIISPNSSVVNMNAPNEFPCFVITIHQYVEQENLSFYNHFFLPITSIIEQIKIPEQFLTHENKQIRDFFTKLV